jgi:uncharacterized repeat protein (TIGR01451 family)
VRTMQLRRSWSRLPLPNVVAAFFLSAFIVGYVAPAAHAGPGDPDDFAVSIGANPAVAVNVGATITYTVDVDRDAASGGPGDVSVAITSAPAGLTLGAAQITVGTGTCNANSCSLTNVAANGSAQVTITATAAAPGPYTVTATLSGAAPADPDAANDTDDVMSTVNPSANLGITKSAAPTSSFPGQDVTFTLTTTNAGPSDASAVVVTDTLPAGLTFKSSSTGCTATGQNVTCPQTATLANGATLPHSIVATVAATATGSLVNTATVASTTFDPVAANNTATAAVAITAAPAELALTIADAPDPVGPGGDLTYTVVLTNAGPNDAPNVAVAATLPPETTFVSADNGGTLAGSTIGWTVPTVTQTTPVTLTYVVNVNEDVTAESLGSTATLTYGGDTTPLDDTATAATAIGGDADLVVVMSVDDLNPEKGDLVTFAIGVQNLGPNEANGIVLKDKLPAGLKFESATEPAAAVAAPNAYDPSSGEWDPFDLAVDGVALFSVTVVVNTNAPVTNQATATLAAGFSDPIVQNSADSVTLNQADDNDGDGDGDGNGGTGGIGGTGDTDGTSDGTAFTGFTASQLMPWLVFFVTLGLASMQYARRRGHIQPVGSTYGFEPWIL